MTRAAPIATVSVLICSVWVLGSCGRSTRAPLDAAGWGGERSSAGAGALQSGAGTNDGGRTSAGGAPLGGDAAGEALGGLAAGARGGFGTGALGGSGSESGGRTGASGEVGVAGSGIAGSTGNAAGEAGTSADGCVPPPVYSGGEVSTCCAGKPCRGNCYADGTCHCESQFEGCADGFGCCRVLGAYCLSSTQICK
jgi:hypothetical protein